MAQIISHKQIKEMERDAYLQLVHEILDRELNVYSGAKQECERPKDAYFYKVMDIRWKGGIHFEVSASKGNGWYLVSRDHQAISNFYHFHKPDENAIRCMQHLINDIESGRYHSKKTLQEQILAAVEERRLTGYMNTTKWKELFYEIGTNLRQIPLMYKTLFDESEPKCFWTFSGDEDIEYINTAVIEWMKIKPEYVERDYRGALLEDKFQVYSLESELISAFRKHHIPYAYLEREKAYIVYGYR